MAFAVEAIKIFEDENFVCYKYRTTNRQVKFGKFKIEKSRGAIYQLELAEEDKSGAQLKRACFSFIKHWKKGEFPEKTYWCS